MRAQRPESLLPAGEAGPRSAAVPVPGPGHSAKKCHDLAVSSLHLFQAPKQQIRMMSASTCLF